MKKKYGKVLVLMGGWSNEREISLISGKYVLESLISSGVNAISFDLNKDNLHEIKQINPDRVFIILHGKGGEDGEIQLFLDNLNIPYTGSGSNASKICMNKRISKDILLDNNISTPFYKKFDNKDDIEDLEKIFKYPFIVKPSSEGSSIGVNIVENRQDFHQAIKDNKLISNDILIEEYIDGIEYTVGILHDRALPVIKLIPPGKFYDFNAKI
jgi:D-alanine-D-alanine ligase and related ATP-grasp enzymes